MADTIVHSLQMVTTSAMFQTNSQCKLNANKCLKMIIKRDHYTKRIPGDTNDLQQHLQDCIGYCFYIQQ